jgi:hypothetical protein
MRNLTLIVAAALCLTSCGKSDIDKANKLIAERGLVVAPVTELDSLNDYSESLELRIKAADMMHEVDSTLNAGLKTAEKMKADGLDDDVLGYVRNLQESCEAMCRVAYKYETDATYKSFKYSIDKRPVEFLGFQCEASNDSLTYQIVFDKEVSRILLVKESRK